MGRFHGGDPFRVGGKIYGRAQWACCSLLGSGPVEVLARPSSRFVPIREDLCQCLRPDVRPFAEVGHPALRSEVKSVEVIPPCCAALWIAFSEKYV